MTNTFPMPRINLNGTSPEALRREYMVAYDAIRAAEDAIRQITVHDRDYHMIDSEAGRRARQRKVEWLLALNSISTDLSDVVISIDERVRS